MNIEQIKTVGHVSTLNGLPGMSSQELADIAGKLHKNVLRDIQKMLTEIGSSLSSCQFAEVRAPDCYGRLQPLTILDKELTFTLLSRYSFTLSHLIVRRWFELEGAGFERVSISGTVQVLRSENQDRNMILRSLNRGRTPKRLTEEEKEIQRMCRRASDYSRKQGREFV
jgi:phage regulator Rha-like protein